MRRLLFMAAMLPLPVAAQTCNPYDYAVAFIKQEYQMQLMSWGIDRDGNSLELWWSDSGHFATLTTTPAGCTTVAMPQHLHDRLRQPPVRNRAAPIMPLDRGESL